MSRGIKTTRILPSHLSKVIGRYVLLETVRNTSNLRYQVSCPLLTMKSAEHL